MKKGKMIILSGPSGSGKTTISQYLLSKIPELKFSVSCTTRSMRNNEKHGKDYYFLSTKRFISKIKKYQFVEWEEVYPQLFYGTLKNEISKIWNENKHILFDVDVKGGLSLQRKYPYNSLSIFVMVKSMKILKERLFTRNSNNMNIRLNKAKIEWKYANLFDVILLNVDLLKTKKKAVQLVSNFINKSG
ncbi:MAG: guanylate kinase [Flavobacteriales bacterium]|jgi:guanylate kinase|uniref:guanylate kinase n=1 Tax=Blattabacterium sp. (Mastotermes darwiniensis) TaxID=39768 RepID=UPI0002ED22A7|nr:guanylate kinase [Blattabacterium sp. (Mastotermes darwiniensis)]MDR1804734.1 guanylate kinase [Flavobacteriales bacterium]